MSETDTRMIASDRLEPGDLAYFPMSDTERLIEDVEFVDGRGCADSIRVTYHDGSVDVNPTWYRVCVLVPA